MAIQLKKRGKIRNLGFSLVELLVVMVIAVAVIGVTTAAYNRLSDSAYLKSSARHIAASLRHARNYAVATGADSSMYFDLNQRTYKYSGNTRSFKFNSKVDFEILSANLPGQQKGTAQILFAPDGSSSGGRIVLTSKNKSYTVHVDWLTGKVAVDG